MLGKVLETVAPAVFMTKEQGSESALWAATCEELNAKEKRAEVRGRYFTEAYGKAGVISISGHLDSGAFYTWLWLGFPRFLAAQG